MAKKKNQQGHRNNEKKAEIVVEPKNEEQKETETLVSNRSPNFWNFLQFYQRMENIPSFISCADVGQYLILAPPLKTNSVVFLACIKWKEHLALSCCCIKDCEEPEKDCFYSTNSSICFGEEEISGMWYESEHLHEFKKMENGTRILENLLKNIWSVRVPSVKPSAYPNELEKLTKKDFKVVKPMGSFGNIDISHVEFLKKENDNSNYLPQFGFRKKVGLKAPASDHVKLIDGALIQLWCAGPHVLQIIGSSYFNGTAVFTELYAGSLLCFLRANVGKLGQAVKLRWSIEAAEALTSMQFHPDTVKFTYLNRNVRATSFFLTSDLTLKLGNFEYAITADLENLKYDYDSSFTRWIPPETILLKKYDRKSEVWSFGVLVWQIYNEGKEPYAGMRNYEVKMKWMNQWGKCQKDRKVGLKMPKMCPQLIRDLIKSCWISCHCCGPRPSIGQILKQMKEAYQEWMSV